jgi:hypothetical protein
MHSVEKGLKICNNTRGIFVGLASDNTAWVSRGRIQRKTWYMETYAGVDYNLTLCPLQSRLQHIFNGQPYACVDLNPICQSRLYPPVRDFGYGLRLSYLSPTFPMRSRYWFVNHLNQISPKWKSYLKNCWFAKNLLIYLLVLSCVMFSILILDVFYNACFLSCKTALPCNEPYM